MEEGLRAVVPSLFAEPVSEFTRPCFSDEIESAQKNGLLLTRWDGSTHFVIREQLYHVLSARPKQELERILDKYPQSFSMASITEPYASDLVAN